MEAENKSKLSPGSVEAMEEKCLCPVLDNHHGKGVGGGLYWINGDCPLHGIEFGITHNPQIEDE